MQTKHAVAALLIAAGSLPAAYAGDTIPYLGLQGSAVLPDNARDQEHSWGGTVLFGFPIGDYFAPELNFFGQRADRKTTGATEGEWGGGIDLTAYPFGRSSWVSPFLMIGGGGLHDYRHYAANTYGYADAGGGVLINLDKAHDVALRIDAKRYMVFDEHTSPDRTHVLDTRINAGVQIALGTAEKPLPPPPPPPPPPAPPADSDGDGVIDSIDQCPNTPQGVKVDSRGCPLPPPPPRDSDGDGVLDNADACPNTPRGMKVDARGCAIKAAKIVLHDINFQTDSSQLTASAKAELDRIADGMRGQPTMALIIEGHTDSTGPDAYNLQLSKQRARAARDYLFERGIEASRLEAEGYGESRPIASNKTKEGRAENRRVEFKVEQE